MLNLNVMATPNPMAFDEMTVGINMAIAALQDARQQAYSVSRETIANDDWNELSPEDKDNLHGICGDIDYMLDELKEYRKGMPCGYVVVDTHYSKDSIHYVTSVFPAKTYDDAEELRKSYEKGTEAGFAARELRKLIERMEDDCISRELIRPLYDLVKEYDRKAADRYFVELWTCQQWDEYEGTLERAYERA